MSTPVENQTPWRQVRDSGGAVWPAQRGTVDGTHACVRYAAERGGPGRPVNLCTSPRMLLR